MYKLAFGPKAFIVVSDPVVVRHLLKVCEDVLNAQRFPLTDGCLASLAYQGFSHSLHAILFSFGTLCHSVTDRRASHSSARSGRACKMDMPLCAGECLQL